MPQIFRFSGLPLDQNFNEILTWMRNHTSAAADNGYSTPAGVPHRVKQNLQAEKSVGAFGTTRDSQEVVNKWLGQLNWTTVTFMQRSCGRQLFQDLGYQFYENKEHYRQAIENGKSGYDPDWSPERLLAHTPKHP